MHQQIMNEISAYLNERTEAEISMSSTEQKESGDYHTSKCLHQPLVINDFNQGIVTIYSTNANTGFSACQQENDSRVIKVVIDESRATKYRWDAKAKRWDKEKEVETKGSVLYDLTEILMLV